MAYIGNQPNRGQILKFRYTANASQTVFSGTDDQSTVMSYAIGTTEVFLNGIKLVPGVDFTANDGTSVSLISGAASGDIFEVISFGQFNTSAPDIFRYNSNNGIFEGFDGTNWSNVTVGTTSGGGLFKGENGQRGSSAGDIFRVNEQILNANVTINSDENASCTGPLTLANNVVITVANNGTLAIL